MFAFKKNYFLILKNTKDLDIKNIKKKNKFNIIYRNYKIEEKIIDLLNFRKSCKVRGINFFVANNLNLCRILKSDGIYISSSNKNFYPNNLNIDIIGSAHNIKEIFKKRKQRCRIIILSKLFKVDYDPSSNFYDITKFNQTIGQNKEIIPLGGIKLSNLNKLKIIKSDGLAIMSEIKKKPAIIRRLF